MIYRIHTFLSYLINGKTKYRLHSPFVFDFVKNTIADTRKYYAFNDILEVKKSTKRKNKKIEITDLGAGSDGKIKKERSINAIVNQSAITKKYGELIFKIVKHYQPNTILELGTCVGIGTLYMASANSNATVYTIEGDPNIAKIAQTNFDKLPNASKNIVPIIGNFDDVLEPTLEKIDEIGLAFIDGNHRKKPTLDYFNKILEKCTTNSILIFDDIYWSKEMGEAWEEIKQNERVTLTIDFYRLGLVFFVKDRKAVEHFKLYY